LPKKESETMPIFGDEPEGTECVDTGSQSAKSGIEENTGQNKLSQTKEEEI